ncbi:hypothetical protein BKA66DRAFT_443959 [Pyrenochaeta sp. MPI-SDFR-AT-0127]|nr:hypothetical protein BKA66DRAFT_443959 [Pyrenochaeta sp. MPI-SDFR-AT-0127]
MRRGPKVVLTGGPRPPSKSDDTNTHVDKVLNAQYFYHSIPGLIGSTSENFDSLSVPPEEDKFETSGWVEVDDSEWTDEQLIDDGRPGRRKGNTDQDSKLRSMVNAVKRLTEEGLKRHDKMPQQCLDGEKFAPAEKKFLRK